MLKIALLNEANFQRFVWYYTVTIKSKLRLACRSSLGSRLFRMSCFQITRKSIEVKKIFEKYQPWRKVKVNKKCQAIGQLLRNKLPLSVSLKFDQKYKNGKQFTSAKFRALRVHGLVTSVK